jgi:hypothetical protein
MQDSAAAYAYLFKHKKRQLDAWTDVGLSAAKFKPLIFPVYCENHTEHTNIFVGRIQSS